MRTSRFIRVSIVMGAFVAGPRAVSRADAVAAARRCAGAAERDRSAQERLRSPDGGARGEAHRDRGRAARRGQPARPAGGRAAAAADGAGTARRGGRRRSDRRAARVWDHRCGRGGAKVFNPDMAVIGDFLGAAGSNKVNPNPALEMHESEAAFQAVVDPYARADFFISFGEEGVDLEEGFITFTELPGGLAHEGRQDARGVRQGERASQSRPALDRPAARHQ